MINVTIDGGGTKIQAIKFDESGNILSSARSGGINFRFETAEAIDRHITDVLSECDLIGKQIDNLYYVMVSGFEPLNRCLKKHGITCLYSHMIEEGYGCLLAASCGNKGIVALSGTGSGAIACNGEHNVLHNGGYGMTIGDDGSGTWIGVKGINYALRNMEHWGDDTLLTQKLYQYLGSSDRSNMLTFLYPKDRSLRSVYSGFCKYVSEAADEGDKPATCILEEAGILMAKQTIACIRSFSERFGEELKNIYACGGAWNVNHAMYDSFTEYIYTIDRTYTCRRARYSPVYAGYIKYMKENGAEDDVIHKKLL